MRWLGVVGAIMTMGAIGGSVQAASGPAATSPRAQTDAVPVASSTAHWPAVKSAVRADARLDARARQIVAGMTLAQKVGQMTQAEIKSITPEQVREFYIGSVLNGGGSWPHGNKHTSIADWLALADQYHDASMHTDAKVKVPVIWGTDAVHGHSNVFGATLYPHNIGLGAAHDVALIHDIGVATAQAVRASGIAWVFAPTVAVAQNARWGRTYESFSSQAPLVHDYARAYVDGLQGDFGEHHVLATAKHFIGDGATHDGTDQGQAQVDRDTMIRVHGAGYVGAMQAGVQSIMASYNSWDDRADGVDYGKMTGARALLSGALKQQMGFTGFIVSDWNAIGQLPGCTNASCPAAINAGIDMVMVPDDWHAFITNTLAQVRDGTIPMLRIDDAVTRIVRAKLQLGLFDGRRPSQRAGAGDAQLLRNRELARRAVRESLVLLKNNHGVLPLQPGTRVLVVGPRANSIADQAGGWSLTWQGTDNTAADFPVGDSLLAGIRAVAGAANVSYSASANDVDLDAFDVIIAVVGETPYAETMGDLVPAATLRHTDRHPEDLALLKTVAAAGKPVVTVFLSGRPLFVNDLLNLSDAFVAAWLPGTEGGGVADVLFANGDGRPVFDFRGTLSMPWPGVPCPPSASDADSASWLFAPGYGLHYPSHYELPALPVHADVHACAKVSTLSIFHTAAVAPYALYLGAADAAAPTQALGADLNAAIAWPSKQPLLRVRTVQVNTQQDAKAVTWLAPARFFARSPQPVDLAGLLAGGGALQFDVVVDAAARGAVNVYMACGADCQPQVDIAHVLAAQPLHRRQQVSIPLRCFVVPGHDLRHVEVPFGIAASAPFAAAFADVRIVAGGANTACPGSPAQ